MFSLPTENDSCAVMRMRKTVINSGVRTHAAQRANSSGPRCIPTAARTLRKHTHFLYTPILVIVFYVCGLVQALVLVLLALALNLALALGTLNLVPALAPAALALALALAPGWGAGYAIVCLEDSARSGNRL